jgi:hypothetical protein
LRSQAARGILDAEKKREARLLRRARALRGQEARCSIPRHHPLAGSQAQETDQLRLSRSQVVPATLIKLKENFKTSKGEAVHVNLSSYQCFEFTTFIRLRIGEKRKTCKAKGNSETVCSFVEERGQRELKRLKDRIATELSLLTATAPDRRMDTPRHRVTFAVTRSPAQR